MANAMGFRGGLRIGTIATAVSAILLVVGAVVVTTSVVTLRELDNIEETWERFENSAADKSAVLNDLRAALGFGGMIHQFKNFVLRRDRLRLIQIQSKLLESVVALTAYRMLEIDDAESKALEAINRVVTHYANAIVVAERMASRGATSAEIDRAVKVDDTLAIAAMVTLHTKLVQVHISSQENVTNSVRTTKRFVSLASPIVAVLLAILIVSFFWFTRVRVLRPIAALADALERLARGEDGIVVPWVGRRDELGGMADNVQVFKESLAEIKRLQSLREQAERQLRSSEERLRDAVESIADGFVLFDRDDGLLIWNKRFAELYPELASMLAPGVTAEDMFRERYRSGAVGEFDISADEYVDWRINMRHRKIGTPAIHRHTDGRWFRTTESKTTEGGIVAISTDISELKEREAAVATSEARFRDFAAASADYYWEMDENLRFSYFSDSFTEITGVPQKALLGKTRDETGIPDVDREVWERHLADLAEHRPFRNFIHPRALPDGGIRYFSINGMPVFGEDGRYQGYRGTGSDVTEHIHATEELARQKAVFESIFRAAPDSMILTDKDRNIVMANPAMTKMFGYEPEEVIGRSSEVIYESREEWERQGRLRYNQSAEDKLKPYPVSYRRKNGEVFPGETIGASLRDADGAILGFIGMTRDITERKAMEQGLRQAQRMEAVGQLTGGVAHDFNNLLTVVEGNLAFLAEDEADQRKQKYIDAARRAALRGAELTQRLLSFSRQASLQPRPVDLGPLLADLAELLRRTLDETVAIDTRLADGLRMPMTDPGQLENALLNLALNARDAMPEGGALIFEAGNVAIGGHGRPGGPELEPGEYVLISVTDSGTGMLPEVLDRAFEPFFTTKEVGKGSGLGLSMVYGFASQSGGRLEIESEPGKGTTAKLYLPQASDNPAAQQRPAEPGLEVIGHGESILVVEDDPSVRELVVGMLASLGYKTLEAAQGNEALEIIDSDQGIDLLFTDVVLPGGMSGLDIAREAVRRRPGLKVVYTTGYARCRAADFSADGEAVEILLKPFRKHDLAIRLAANLRP